MRRPGRILVCLSLGFTVTAASSARADEPETPYDEKIVVTSTRLDDDSVPEGTVPAHVTIIDRERIEASGARNLQDLLSSEAGVVLVDQVGNDVQKTLDLRGFTGGKGVAVFVDGARVNDPRNNAAALEQVPLESIDRIEITRGPAAALAGGGAEAGVIRVVTRRGTEPGAGLAVSGGTWGTRAYDGSYGDRFGRFDLFASGSYEGTDGFRPNAGGRQARFDAAGGLDLGGERRLSLSLLSSDLHYGNPGALTRAEFESDPTQNVFNLLDATDGQTRQASLSFSGPVCAGFSLSTNVAYRDDDSQVLTTGRSAPLFGGFFLDSNGGSWSAVGQAIREVGAHRVAFGVELLDGETESTGFFTSPSSPGIYDPSAPASRNTADVRNGGLFAQDSWTLSSRWQLMGGFRADGSRVSFHETVAPIVPPSGERTFSEISFRAGATMRASDTWELYASYADAFLPPTPEQLFAFPGFGSNPDLDAEDTRSFEIGARAHGRSYAVAAAMFLADTADEIVFDPTPRPGAPFGQNMNADATRRIGVELSARGRLASRVHGFTNVTYTDAAFSKGVNDGNDVPLVPKLRMAAGIDAILPAGFGVGADALYVGSQVLDNDAANQRERLASYTVANLRGSWERATKRGGRPGAFVEVKNVLDQTYATRGIFAFDFSTGTSADFVTPAPGRRYLAGVTWRK